jgi:hypothetical protein
MRDTTAEAAGAQLAAFRRLSPAERVALALEASDWLMAVARARQSEGPDVPPSAGAGVIDAPPPARAPRSQ